MTPLHDKPTHVHVRDLLGLPPADASNIVIESLSPMQRLGWAIMEAIKMIENLSAHGCQMGQDHALRIAALETERTRAKGWISGAYAAAAIFASLALFLFAAIAFVRSFGVS